MGNKKKVVLEILREKKNFHREGMVNNAKSVKRSSNRPKGIHWVQEYGDIADQQ